MKVEKTERGFEIIRFFDRYGEECTLQQSSLADYQEPGTSAIWFGIGEHRMHIDLDQLREILPHLKAWVNEGSFIINEA